MAITKQQVKLIEQKIQEIEQIIESCPVDYANENEDADKIYYDIKNRRQVIDYYFYLVEMLANDPVVQKRGRVRAVQNAQLESRSLKIVSQIIDVFYEKTADAVHDLGMGANGAAKKFYDGSRLCDAAMLGAEERIANRDKAIILELKRCATDEELEDVGGKQIH